MGLSNLAALLSENGILIFTLNLEGGYRVGDVEFPSYTFKDINEINNLIKDEDGSMFLITIPT